ALRSVSNRLKRFELRVRVQTVARFCLNYTGSLAQHSLERRRDLFRQLSARRGTHTSDTGAYSPTCCGNFFIARAGNAFFKIDQAWRCKDRVSVAVNEGRQHYPAAAITDEDFALVVPHPRIAREFATAARVNNLPTSAKNRGIRDQANIVQVRTAPWRRIASQREELANVG